MNTIIISSSPNKDGLTAACTYAAYQGIQSEGAEGKIIWLNDLKIGNCQACGRGWGTCLEEHQCQVLDDFQVLNTSVNQANALILITPVYWGEMSESAKAFTDRLRRCEAPRGDLSGLYNKPIIGVAAAGGSGGGMITCLSSIEHWIHHVRARLYDLIPVNRWSREYKLITIQSAAKSMAIEMLRQDNISHSATGD